MGRQRIGQVENVFTNGGDTLWREIGLLDVEVAQVGPEGLIFRVLVDSLIHIGRRLLLFALQIEC